MSIASFALPSSVHASMLGDFVNGVRATVMNGVDEVKDFFTPDPKKEFTIDSNITLAPGGDVDQNGQIDAGDTIRFKYKLNNHTEKEYSWLTLKTNIDRKRLNNFRNEFGTLNMVDDGKTIMIPHIKLSPNQDLIIRFDATVNFSTKEDLSISTEPEIVTNENKIILKMESKQVVAKKLSDDRFKSLINNSQYLRQIKQDE